MMETARWLTCFRPLPNPRWRLYCFPSAGGGVSMYSSWPGELAPGIELTALCPPGRERNLAITPHRDMSTLVEDLLEALTPGACPPYAFFGHSVGAAVAFEAAARMWQTGAGPTHLFLSACPPPHLPNAAHRTHLLGDGELIDELAGFGGLPQGLTDEPDLLRLILPALRADLEIAAGYRAVARAPLPCGITALGGLEDAAVAATDLGQWRAATRGPFHQHLLPGGHFYLSAQRSIVLAAIARDLAVPPYHDTAGHDLEELPV